MNCYDCPAAQIFPKPENHGYYSIYGFCHKDTGHAYPIYVPEGVCRHHRKMLEGSETP